MTEDVIYDSEDAVIEPPKDAARTLPDRWATSTQGGWAYGVREQSTRKGTPP
jgi:citrate lyase beta subunit